MRILGIDPGSRITGFGIIDVQGEDVTLVQQGVIRAGDGEFTARLGIIFEGLRKLMQDHAPHEVAVETVFISHNANSALKLGQARGAAVCAAISMGLPVAEYSPRSVKQAIVGRGGADKVQVQHMVGVLLQVREALAEDAADALAVALCHQHTRQTVNRMQALRKT
jgi:crossover junction endodeoxyribonuclease RuvC